MIIYSLLILLRAALAYNLVSLGNDLGVIPSLPDHKNRSKIENLEFKISKFSFDQNCNLLDIKIDLCAYTKKSNDSLDLQSLLSSFSSHERSNLKFLNWAIENESQCFLYFFFMKGVQELKNSDLNQKYYQEFYYLENDYKYFCSAMDFIRADAFFKYFNQTTERDVIENFLFNISMYKIIFTRHVQNDLVLSKVFISFVNVCENKSGKISMLSYDYLLCWIRYLIEIKFGTYVITIFDDILKQIKINLDCSKYIVGLDDIIKVNFPDYYEKYSKCTDLYTFTMAVSEIINKDLPKKLFDKIINMWKGEKKS
jgi:hypothetical protein